MLRSPQKAANDRTRRTRRQLGLESLEGRQLMTLGVETGVNTTTSHDQYMSDVASAANGLSVVVWIDEFSGTDRDVKAQMYNADGSKRGPQISVDSRVEDSLSPAVAMDADGDWVVVWDHKFNGQWDVYSQRFSSSGARLGNEQIIAGSDLSDETDPDVAMDAKGNFVVSYTKNTAVGNADVFARRFGSTGDLLQTLAVGNLQSATESRPSVAMNGPGAFVVAYESEDHVTGDPNIILNRYNASGISIGNRTVAASGTDEMAPSVGLDDDGNAVVAYEKYVGTDVDIKATRVRADGTAGGEINVRNTSANEFNPVVAPSRRGGAFVVAYNTDLLHVPGNRTVEVAEVSSSNAVTSVFNLPAFPNNEFSSVSIDALGNYVLSYTGGFGSGDTNIKMRRGRLS